MEDDAGPEHHLVVLACGVPILINAGDADTATRLRTQWVRALTDLKPQATVDYQPEDLDVVGPDYRLTVAVTRAALELTSKVRLNLHAGGVARADGQTLVVIGASGAGKTTAVRTLAKRLHYLSDETISIDLDDLSIAPHPKPLSVILKEDESHRKVSVSPDEAQLASTLDRGWVRRVVILNRGGSPEGLTALTVPEAIVHIVPQTSGLLLRERPLLDLVELLSRCGGAIQLTYSEITDQVDALIQILEAPVAESPAVAHHPPPIEGPAVDPTLWSRQPWHDAIALDDQLVVMRESTAHLLEGLGTTLWLALAQPRSLEELVQLTQQAHGAHDDADAIVKTSLQTLQESDLVQAPNRTALNRPRGSVHPD